MPMGKSMSAAKLKSSSAGTEGISIASLAFMLALITITTSSAYIMPLEVFSMSLQQAESERMTPFSFLCGRHQIVDVMRAGAATRDNFNNLLTSRIAVGNS